MTNVLIRATGGDPDRGFDIVQSDELRFLVSLSASEGGIEKYPAQLIDRVLAFEARTVKDAMVPRTQMVALELTDGVERILEVGNESGHSRLPVYRENMDEIVGVFHVKDLLSEPSANWDGYRLAQHLYPPYFVPESAHLGRTIRDFQKKKIHLAVVVDEFGGTEGLITLEDILEELVGEIQDEFDREIVMMRRLPSGALEVSGRTPIDDLMKVFPSWSRDTSAKTVSGLIMEITGRVPAAGEVVHTEGIKLTVLGSDERQIERVRVESTTDEKADTDSQE
jgi:CBS domain containing-hemolysin-like protein